MKRLSAILVGIVLLGLIPANSKIYDFSKAYKETRPMSGFTGISLSGSCRVLFTPSDKYEVILEGDKDDVTKYVTDMQGGVLRLYMPSVDESGDGVKRFFGHLVNSVSSDITECNVRIRVSAPNISSLSVSGSGEIEVMKDWTSDSDIEASIAGSSEIIMRNLTAQSFSVKISGSGKFSSGTVQTAKAVSVKSSGSGSLEFDVVKAKTVEMSTAGSGDVRIETADISDRLDVKMAGSGDLRINGNAGHVVINISGSGSVKGRLAYDSIDSTSSGSGKIKLSK